MIQKSRRGSAGALTYALVFAFLAGLPPALAFGEPRLEPDERLLARNPPTHGLDARSFAALALIASGAGDQTERLEAELSSMGDELASLAENATGGREKTELILAFMYEKTLSRYSEFQTRLDIAIQKGEYNCVSSSVLFAYFAKRLGLETYGNETPNHSFCTVLVDGKPIDVETTNPFGFDPGNRKELPGEREGETRYLLVPKTTYRNRTKIDDRRLIALIYNNRISMLERSGRFEEAAGLAVDALTLQGENAPPGEIADRFLNYAINLSAGGDHEKALGFIERARGEFFDFPRYREFENNTVQNAVADLVKKEEYDEARRLLARYRLRVDPSVFKKTAVYVWAKKAETAARGRDWLAAAAVVEEGLAEIPGDKSLQNQRNAYRDNFAVEVHNRFAAEMNRGNRDEARRILEEGLAFVPESALLKQDLAQLEKIR